MVKGPSRPILAGPGAEDFVLQPSLEHGFPLWPSPLGLRDRLGQKSNVGAVALYPPLCSDPTVTSSASFLPHPITKVCAQEEI